MELILYNHLMYRGERWFHRISSSDSGQVGLTKELNNGPSERINPFPQFVVLDKVVNIHQYPVICQEHTVTVAKQSLKYANVSPASFLSLSLRTWNTKPGLRRTPESTRPFHRRLLS